MTRLLSWLLGSEAARELLDVEHEDLDAYLAVKRATAALWDDPFDRAVVGGYAADRLGYAFVAGYRAALAHLVPGIGAACLCVTEEGGGHPRELKTTALRDGPDLVVDGVKRWSTLADRGEVLLVAAVEGEHHGRPKLAVVAVPAEEADLRPMADTPFVPEIGHFEVHLDRVRVAPEARLPGDGYTRYVKPFRTVEDVHVGAATLAYLLRVGTGAGWSTEVRARLLHGIAALRGLAGADPLDPAVHVAVGAAYDGVRAAADADWGTVHPDAAARWKRDRPLLDIAGKARARRLERAWERLTTRSPPR